jgi:cytochrome c oxidase assembly protein subunit 15
MENQPQARPSPWPHRLAVVLALVTFPLIWVGGLVTTYDAGMAVPDWPGTYGYNLLAYPLSTWLAGPWDLFIEHGHRLLGATAGFVAIALVVMTFWTDRRPWLRIAAVGALALVVFQGALGGARVLFDERVVALIHGCVGPLFFAYLAALIVATSRFWATAKAVEALKSAAGTHLVRAVWITVALAYVQLVLGAIVRHVPLMASSQVFRLALLFHLIVAAILVVQMLLTAHQAWNAGAAHAGLRMPGLLLPLLLLVQIALGIGTYVAKYSWPAWLSDYQFAASYVVTEKSLTQSLITTAHVANGSLILFVSVLLAARTTRTFCTTNSFSIWSGSGQHTEFSTTALTSPPVNARHSAA